MSPHIDHRVVLLVAQTPIHCGVGPGAQPVDLPVQRDVATNFPVVRGSELKGALTQSLFWRLGADRDTWEHLRGLVFGSTAREEGEELSRIGLFTVLDAHVLLVPTASLYGGYAYVTCPALLHRFAERVRGVVGDLHDVLKSVAGIPDARRDETALVEPGSSIALNKKLVLHPWVKFTPEESNGVKDFVDALVARGLGDVPLKLRNHVVVVSDDAASYVVNHAMLVQPHVRLDYDSKTVKYGPWLEESIPRFAILHSALLFWKGERLCVEVPKGKRELYEKIVGLVRNATIELKGGSVVVEVGSEGILSLLLPKGERTLIVGGDVTTGQGLFTVVEVG